MINSEVLEGWRYLTLKELSDPNDKFSFKGGPFGSDLKSAHYTESGVRVLQLQDIGKGYFLNKSRIYTSIEKADELEACNVYPGDILLAKMSPVARCCIVPNTAERFVMCSDGIRLAVDPSKVDRDFVYYALNDQNFLDKAESKSTGTTRARIGLTDLRGISIFCPPLEEQLKIAEVLYSVDQKIDLIDQNIIQTEQLKIGLMQKLFTQGLGVQDKESNWQAHIEFKDSHFGKIPKCWEVKTLEEIASFITKGATPTTYGFDWVEKEGGTPFLRSECVTDNGFKTKGVKYISKEAHDAMERSKIYSGDLLMTITGNIGRVSVLPDCVPEANINQHIAKISINKDENSNFIFQALKQKLYSHYYNRILTGQAYPQISLKQVRETPIALPPSAERKEISTILSNVDEKLELLKHQKAETQQLKKGLMQKLLTGEWRIPLDDNGPA